MTSLSDDDEAMLQELVSTVEDDDAETRFNVSAFRRMLSDGRALSDKQRAWLRDVHEKIVGAPHYENLVSSGKVPLGRPVETPAVLLNLPKKPPMRKVSLDD